MSNEAMQLLVDSHHGIYCWKSLAERYFLYRDDGTQLPQDNMIQAFDPDNEYWCDEVDCNLNTGLYVMNDDKTLWRVDQIEGDIWAINPEAEWSEEDETYYMPEIDK